MDTMVKKAVEAYYGYDIEAYQCCIAEMESIIKKTVCEKKKFLLIGKYKLVRSLAYLNMPGKLCEFYEEAIREGVKTNMFDISGTYLLAWAYEDLIEYFGMPLEKADHVADQLEKAVRLHSYFSNVAKGTDWLYRAELALQRKEYEKALYLAHEAAKLLPVGNTPAHECSSRIVKHAHQKICIV